MTFYPFPGACRNCGSKLTMVFVDWQDDTQPYGIDGGVRWHCPSCAAPKHTSAWASSIRDARIDKRLAFHELAPLVGCTVPELSAIERGAALPTPEQRAALNGWLASEGVG